MRKLSIILIALLTVLLVFVSCDEAIDDVFDSGTITLEIRYDYYRFDNGTNELEMRIPSGCETWGDLIQKGCSISIHHDAEPSFSLNLIKRDTYYAVFSDVGKDVDVFDVLDKNVKSDYPKVRIDDPIRIDGTYVLRVIPT